MEKNINLTTKLGRLKLKNPVLVASGTFGYGEEYAQFLNLNELGGIVTKAVTLNPTVGNPSPRLIETPAGLLNCIGLENPGVDVFIKEKLSFLKKFNVKIIVNIAGEKESDYLELTKILSKVEGIDALEINVSCPNVKRGGYSLGTNPKKVYFLTKSLKKITHLPLIVKLTPNVTDVIEIAKAAKNAGAEALSLINTLLGMAINVSTQRPKLSNITGGLSGPAIRPVAVRMVWQVAQKVKIPLIGMGGIMNPEDALEFILVGASAIAIGTANFVDPKTPIKVVKGIKCYLKEKKINNFQELIGKVKTGRIP